MDKQPEYKLLLCYHCGNKGLLRVENIYQYTVGGPVYDEVNEIIDFDPIEKYKCFTLVCPVCNKVSLYEECEAGYGYGYTEDSYAKNLYPEESVSLEGVPSDIKNAFEVALKVKNIDADICLLSLRRVLEAICKDNGAEGRTLADKIRDMISKNVLPDMFDDACWVIRELGNSAAHADGYSFYSFHVEQTIDFVKTIIEYLYVLPEKMKTMRGVIEFYKYGKVAKE